MGVLVAIGAAIATTVATVAAVVGTVILTVVTSLVSALAAIGVAVASAVAGTVTGVLSALGIITTETATGVLTSLGLSNTIGTMTQLSIGKWVSALGTMWKSFAEAIHLKTILQLHEIAYIVSSDYRKMMQRVYGRISDVSDALGFYPQFIGLALRNARTVVLNTSALLGRKYDLAEVTWFENLNEFCTELGDQAEKYKKNPEAIFDLIDRLVIKPQSDVGGETGRTMLGTIDQIVDRTQEIVGAIDTISGDVYTFIEDLPVEFKEKLKTIAMNAAKLQMEIRELKVYPRLDTIDAVIEVIQKRQEGAEQDINDILDKMKKAGDWLEDVDTLPYDERTLQHTKIDEVTSRQWREESENLVLEAAKAMEQLESIASALREPLEVVQWIVPELESPNPVKQEEMEPLDTWYVGDY